MAARKIRTDSFHTQAEMAAAKPPEPPSHVRLLAKHKPYWDAIVRAREYNSWTEAELEHVANLARCRARMEELDQKIDREGILVTEGAGKKKVNPILKLHETLTKSSIQMSRLLMVHANATAGQPHEVRKRNVKQREVSRTIAEQDDLLARPTH